MALGHLLQNFRILITLRIHKTANAAPILRRSLHSKYHTASRYTRIYNFTYAFKKRATFPAAIFTELTNAQQHCVQICYTEFHPNRTVNVESTDSNLSMELSTAWFARDRNNSTHFYGHVLYQILSKSNTAENTGKFSFKPFSKTWLSLYRLSHNPTTDQRHYVEIFCTKFHLIRSINTESTGQKFIHALK